MQRPWNLPRSWICLVLALALGCAAAVGAAPSEAQGQGGLMAADEEMVQQLLKSRPMEGLKAEYDAAKRRAEAADTDLAEATRILSVARARVDVKKDEIALLKTRSKLARREAKDADRAEIEKLLSREESALRVFEAMRDAAEAQKDRAEAAADFARARMKTQEAEMDVVRRRDDRIAEAAKEAAAADPAALERLKDMDGEIRKSSRSALASLRAYAKSSKRLAERTDDLARARLDLLDAWEKYKGP